MMSLTNEALQQWGKEFMLRVANDHLAKVPLFELKTPLREDDVLVRTYLNLSGAVMDLSTADRKYAIYYERGVLCKAVAHEAEMASAFYPRTNLEAWSRNVRPWSKQDAKKTAEALLRSKGLVPEALGAKAKPIVTTAIFNLPFPNGNTKPVILLYTVSWPHASVQNADVLTIEFRCNHSGQWEPTLWFNASTTSTDTESASLTNLVSRFFQGSVRQ